MIKLQSKIAKASTISEQINAQQRLLLQKKAVIKKKIALLKQNLAKNKSKSTNS